MQENLRKAEDVRWAKEGEVTILRKGIQKVCSCVRIHRFKTIFYYAS